mmetsp:Transcript_12170/g.22009  ORF Transcript_12170/g.22009 Transcript_12170/m.22009 type:complete len:202 (-) Transcript_12170:55-660(-)
MLDLNVLKMSRSVSIEMPEWTVEFLETIPCEIKLIEDRMRLVLELARKNVLYKTGGPFAAAVFEAESGALISIGVNRVENSYCSCAHAEFMAISLAQQLLKDYDLGRKGRMKHQLVVNWRPCTMCFGSVLWSGIRSLVIAGHGDELEEITGFDEGPICENWREELKIRGIELIIDVLRNEAIDGFKEFAASGNTVYNSRQG